MPKEQASSLSPKQRKMVYDLMRICKKYNTSFTTSRDTIAFGKVQFAVLSDTMAGIVGGEDFRKITERVEPQKQRTSKKKVKK